MKKLSAFIFNIQPWTIDTSFSFLVIVMGPNLIFLASMVMIQLDGFTGKNTISVCITLLMSIKSHLHPFIWNMNPFNGSIGTWRIMKSHNWHIFSKSFWNDLALVILMTSHEHSPNFVKLALWGSIRQNLRNWPITQRDCMMHSTGVVLSVV